MLTIKIPVYKCFFFYKYLNLNLNKKHINAAEFTYIYVN